MKEKELYTSKARVQLDFRSYLKMSMMFCWGFILIGMIFAALAYPTFSFFAPNAYIVLFIYPLGHLLYGLAASLIAYPFYKRWCLRWRGQEMSGKFALLKDTQEKSAG